MLNFRDIKAISRGKRKINSLSVLHLSRNEKIRRGGVALEV